MNFSVGVFDLFAATVPGSLYVAIFLYVGQRTGWPGVDRLAEADTTVLIVCGVLVAYLLGTVFGAVAQALSRLPTMTPSPQEALREFRDRNPDLAGRRFLTIDHYTLLAGLGVDPTSVGQSLVRRLAGGLWPRALCGRWLL